MRVYGQPAICLGASVVGVWGTFPVLPLAGGGFSPRIRAGIAGLALTALRGWVGSLTQSGACGSVRLSSVQTRL